MKPPADCQDMADIRIEIDRLDASLMALLVQRAAYIERAAQIKAQVGLPARLTDRVTQVLANVAAHAAGAGLPPTPYVEMWRVLIEAAIAREEEILQKGSKDDR